VSVATSTVQAQPVVRGRWSFCDLGLELCNDRSPSHTKPAQIGDGVTASRQDAVASVWLHNQKAVDHETRLQQVGFRVRGDRVSRNRDAGVQLVPTHAGLGRWLRGRADRGEPRHRQRRDVQRAVGGTEQGDGAGAHRRRCVLRRGVTCGVPATGCAPGWRRVWRAYPRERRSR